MKWVYIKSADTVDHYTLFKNDTPLLQLKYNHHTDTARVNYNEDKRAFMIQPDDEMKSRICLKNEYGIELGYLAYENLSGSEGPVQIEDKKYWFVSETGSTLKLSVYNKSSIAPLVNCEIASSISISESRLFEKSPLHAALLLILSWYLYLPVKSRTPILEW